MPNPDLRVAWRAPALRRARLRAASLRQLAHELSLAEAHLQDARANRLVPRSGVAIYRAPRPPLAHWHVAGRRRSLGFGRVQRSMARIVIRAVRFLARQFPTDRPPGVSPVLWARAKALLRRFATLGVRLAFPGRAWEARRRRCMGKLGRCTLACNCSPAMDGVHRARDAPQTSTSLGGAR